MSYLLDTNVLSEAKQKQANPKVINWLGSQGAIDSYISVITLGEIEEGISYLGKTKKAKSLRHWLDDIKLNFQNRILPIDEKTMQIWGELRANARRNGQTLAVMDSLLAATALNHDLVLVTRNTSDFNATGVRLFNPWLEG